MVLMARPESASHACKLKVVRLKGSPEAKLRIRTATIRLSLSACSRVGFADSAKDAELKETGRGRGEGTSREIITGGTRALRIGFTLAARRIPCETARA